MDLDVDQWLAWFEPRLAHQNRLFVGIDNDPDEVATTQGWLSELGLD